MHSAVGDAELDRAQPDQGAGVERLDQLPGGIAEPVSAETFAPFRNTSACGSRLVVGTGLTCTPLAFVRQQE